MLKGIGVSDGIGIGNVVIIDDRSLDFTPREICDVEAEKNRFSKAVEEFIARTTKQAESIRASVGDKEAEILEGHITMINDPFMSGEIDKNITSGKCAEESLSIVCEMFIGMFTASGDEMTMQRAADVRDIRDGVLSVLLGVEEVKISDVPKGTVIVTKELTPSMTAGIVKDNIEGIVTETGSRTSHSAILAKALEIPAVLSVKDALANMSTGDKVIVDGDDSTVIVGPSDAELTEYTAKRDEYLKEKKELEAFRGKKTVSASGEEYELFCNIGKPDDAKQALESDGEGIGLFRTEFLFMDRGALPTEDEQFEAYKQASMIMQGKPIIIRTLDVGGDKEIPYLGLEKEENPFMGFRAIRYCLANRDMFKTQLRAILRASAFGEIRIMFPLITAVEELRQGKELVEEAKKELKSEGIDFDDNIKVGIMTETAASGVIADLLAKESDFFSIGTNDLTGYTMEVDRGNSNVAYLYSTFQPSVLRMIKRIIECANDAGIDVGMCGEAAADIKMVPLLMSFGLTEFSVSAPSVLKVRKTISSLTKEEADKIADKVMAMATEEEIVNYLSSF